MGNLFRSEEMCLAQLFLQSGTAYQCIGQLGERGLVEFRDLNKEVSLFQRRFVGEVRICEELERTLAYLWAELCKASLHVSLEDGGRELPPLEARQVLALQEESSSLRREVQEVSGNRQSLKTRLSELQQYQAVLHSTREMLIDSPPRARDSGIEETAVGSSLPTKLSLVAGLIHPWKIEPFERLLWRACRGHVIVNFADLPDQIEDPETGESVRMVAFLISYWGQEIGQKVRKICDCYHCRIFIYPSMEEEEEILQSLQTRIDDLNTVLSQTEVYLSQVLDKVRRAIGPWCVQVRKMKAIYLVLNQCNFDVTGKCLIAEVWCPKSSLSDLQHDLEEGSSKAGATVPSFYTLLPTDSDIPPTLNRTNKFTAGFQGIVDAYGFGKYREVNPAPYTIITFPFLFAVMFGDVGHGAIMSAFAVWMIFNENKRWVKNSDNEIFQMVFHGRYLLLLMGLFSIYTGFIYNDCFNLSLAIFPSAWHVRPMINQTIQLRDTSYLMLDPVVPRVLDGVYPFGIDPIWHLAINKLTFLNSFKMKMSVILGVIHMTFGVLLGMFNHIHSSSTSHLPLVLLPELLFLVSLFGYLVVLIVYKWLVFNAATSRQAPSILIHFIDMFLFTSSPTNVDLYPEQTTVQTVLLIIAIFSIPFLLLGKPLHVYFVSKRQRGGYTTLEEEAETLINAVNTDVEIKSESENAEDVSDVFMKQAIHTIEYCLSCISNTASYLRLWALSLAHAQLSEVLWTMVLRQGLRRSGLVYSVLLFAAFAVFAVLTVAILLVMEGLSAFLHALRLHWVEFQSKFYAGSGFPFLPFSFTGLDVETLSLPSLNR